MGKKFTSLLCVGLGVIALSSAAALAAGYDIRVASGNDDVEEYVADHSMYVDSSDLEMPYEDSIVAGDEQVIGLRFVVPIPKGAKITKAYVQFTCDETKSGTDAVNLIIKGQLAANAQAFTGGDADVTSRTPTKAQVKWAAENWTTTGQLSKTSDISAIIQEIIDQPGWVGGNALVLILSDDKSSPSKGIRCADAYEDGASTAPLLHVEIFNPAASSPSPADGAMGVTMPLLGWTKGDGAIFHNVYFSKTPDLTEANLVAKNQPFAMYFHVPGLEVATKYYWRVDEIDGTGKLTTGAVWSFMSEPIAAYAPKPADGAADLFPAATLSWSPGKLALQHQVFFSSSLGDVTDGKPAADKGKTTDTKLNPGALRSSTTYYWRVDEITTTGTVNKGPVWSFTTAAGIAKKIVSQWWFNIAGGTVANLTNNPNYPDNPTGTELRDDFQGYGENQYDYYGMRVYGWLTPPQSGDYTFWIAANDAGECWLSTDANPANAKVICSVPNGSGGDPRQWDGATSQKSASITLQAGQKYYIMALQKDSTGRDHVAVAWQGPGIAATTVISSQYVDTFALPPLTAFSPNPANGQADAAQSGALSWSAGDKAAKHDVYFGDDKAAVAAADTKSPLYKGQQSSAAFEAGDLEWGKTYFWRVDEIDAAGAISTGSVWSFTTANFLPVEDMEGYSDEEGNRIYEIWIDGWTNNTGSVVGNLTAPFAERTIVHGGKQAMPMDFDNSKAPFYSEAELDLASVQNWTINGLTDLSLWVRGYPAVASVAVAETAGKMSLTGDGTDIWNNSDDFTFAYKTLNGDGAIVARVVSIGPGSNTWAKAGVMIRDSLDGGSTHAMAVITANSDGTAGNGASFQWRPAANGASSNADSTKVVAAPYWVKIERSGDSLTGYISADGKAWGQLGLPQAIVMTAPAYIGLCVTSHASGEQRTFQFDSITTTGSVTGQWQGAQIASARYNGAANLYVAVEDSAGKVAIASDPTLVNAAAWTQWKIPLSSLTGVNLAKVKKLYVGVGDRKSPVADGAGRIYIDDICVSKP